ncbi:MULTISPECIES: sarcosine oxidase subunit gamma family protein [Alphaproteobacteria]|uniref:Sarcosine oxidase subunit gamma n=2 Tax=Alphaproteobacteria TaxID=28211 RepID=A0A512HL21_9HYPH|nr:MULTISPECIES: sarcosine oxidase subunit gamma family protein [Alphaproteobacteria]GEO86149.1 sarcosine oxidase subunit gamma [Ciceribacter naphthalenivorans]GLR22716.1 sarcosine oxidase subunit gamma [Ciceribacter naphthalenivorans]GLT05572.1 sarcosine oxidase subunit gamma [Sphingomonas psychrolutea]
MTSVFEIESRPALADRKPAFYTDFRLEPLAEGHVLHVLAKGIAGDLSPDIRAAAGGSDLSVRFVSPGQWFIVGDNVLTREELAALAMALKPVGEIVDQSHGRIRIGLSGNRATILLAKGCGVDFDLSQFPIGHATPTLFGHIGTHITRMAQDRFELLVLRTLAQSLWDELVALGLEFSAD